MQKIDRCLNNIARKQKQRKEILHNLFTQHLFLLSYVYFHACKCTGNQDYENGSTPYRFRYIGNSSKTSSSSSMRALPGQRTNKPPFFPQCPPLSSAWKKHSLHFCFVLCVRGQTNRLWNSNVQSRTRTFTWLSADHPKVGKQKRWRNLNKKRARAHATSQRLLTHCKEGAKKKEWRNVNQF